MKFALRPSPRPAGAKSLAQTAERLHAVAVAGARDPRLYAELGAPDSVEGRFELLTAHVILILERLKAGGADSASLRQALFDGYLSHLDGSMREMGVGDLAMGRRMKALGESFYGRAKGFEDAFAALPHTAALEALLLRTTLRDAPIGPAPLALELIGRRERLARLDDGSLMSGDFTWR